MRSIPDIRGAVRERSSLIHCITNPISINQCANAILAAVSYTHLTLPTILRV